MCGLFEIATVGFALTAGEPGVPAGSLVERTGACEGGVAVVVRAAPGHYGPPPVTGTAACVPAEALVPHPGRVLVTEGPDAGEIVALSGDACGGPWRLGDADAGPDDLARVLPISPEEQEAIGTVQATFTDLFGPIGLHRLRWTEWGFVGLPLTPLDEDAVAAEVARETLDTPLRLEKVWRAVGPDRGGPVYAHFEGSDPPGTDAWSRPETLVALLALASGWWDHCTTTLAADPALAAGPATCTLQIGDLSWFNGRRPDPLGHLDHWEGDCVDLRLFRSDGSRYEAWWNRPDDRPGFSAGYSRALTGAFLEWTVGNAPVGDVFFGDPDVDVPGVELEPGHDDHVHVCFRPK